MQTALGMVPIHNLRVETTPQLLTDKSQIKAVYGRELPG